MGYIVRMPTLGPEMGRGTLLEWHVEDGTPVEEGEAVAQVASESGVGEVEAKEEGVLRRTYLEEGNTVLSGTPIGLVAPADADIEDLETVVEYLVDRRELLPATVDGRTREQARVETEMPGRTVTATNPSGMRGRIDAGSFGWQYDEPEDSGGTETGPTPVDVFLGGLASCLSLSTRYQVEKRDADVGEISVTTDANPEHGSVESIEVTVHLASDENDETLARIVDLAERGCHVSQLLRDDLELELSWNRR
ncbi:OsmC family protein [Halobiforma nitratireducens]|uniref:OsmC family protein n=1 Tax=Halobiforma nitratireducens JCM 10879 TaxID=1227454 RepID=M0MIW1_9EURY|nr:OsmC family protein [Halobiforma nitratireducens]EMA44664.1 OsmC family protein [Halobiforma nitratireducens JCM 10879]